MSSTEQHNENGNGTGTGTGEDIGAAMRDAQEQRRTALDSITGVIRETLYKKPGSREQVPAQSGDGVDLQNVSGETIMLDRSGAEQISGERIQMERSGARTIDAKSVQMENSGAVALSSDSAVLLHSNAVQLVTDEARLSHSSVVFLNAGNATLENSNVVFFAGNATGDVQPLLTTRTAGILGGAIAVALLLLGLLLRGGKRG